MAVGWADSLFWILFWSYLYSTQKTIGKLQILTHMKAWGRISPLDGNVFISQRLIGSKWYDQQLTVAVRIHFISL